VCLSICKLIHSAIHSRPSNAYLHLGFTITPFSRSLARSLALALSLSVSLSLCLSLSIQVFGLCLAAATYV
jgi:hypothetical protein